MPLGCFPSFRKKSKKLKGKAPLPAKDDPNSKAAQKEADTAAVSNGSCIEKAATPCDLATTSASSAPNDELTETTNVQELQAAQTEPVSVAQTDSEPKADLKEVHKYKEESALNQMEKGLDFEELHEQCGLSEEHSAPLEAHIEGENVAEEHLEPCCQPEQHSTPFEEHIDGVHDDEEHLEPCCQPEQHSALLEAHIDGEHVDEKHHEPCSRQEERIVLESSQCDLGALADEPCETLSHPCELPQEPQIDPGQATDESLEAAHSDDVETQPSEEKLREIHEAEKDEERANEAKTISENILPTGLHWEPISTGARPRHAVDINELHLPIKVACVETPQGSVLGKYLEMTDSFYAGLESQETIYSEGKVLCMDEGAWEKMDLEWVHISTPDIRNRNLVAGPKGSDGKLRYVARGMVPLEGPYPYYELSSGWVSEELETANLVFDGVEWRQHDFDVLTCRPKCN